MTKPSNKYHDVSPDLPESLSLQQIKERCDDLWLQRAAARPPEEGGANPVRVEVWRPPSSAQ
jgi:hypothetical protein